MPGLEISDSSVQNVEAETALENAAIPAKAKRVLDGRTELYRHYSGRKLLYVGVSLSTMARLAAHKNYSSWFDRITRVEISRYISRSRALKAEMRLIKKHKPPFNIIHQPKDPNNWLREHMVKTFGSYEGWREHCRLLDAGRPSPYAKEPKA